MYAEFWFREKFIIFFQIRSADSPLHGRSQGGLTPAAKKKKSKGFFDFFKKKPLLKFF